jgi:hypothetical protein
MAKNSSSQTSSPKNLKRRPTEDEIRTARQPVADANAELEAAARQLRSAYSFNDADERNRRIGIAQKRHSAAVIGADKALKQWRSFKENRL